MLPASLFAGEPNYHTQKPSGLRSVYLPASFQKRETAVPYALTSVGLPPTPPAAETWSQPNGCLWPECGFPSDIWPPAPSHPTQSPASWAPLVLRRTRSSLSCFLFLKQRMIFFFFLVLKITKTCSVNSQGELGRGRHSCGLYDLPAWVTGCLQSLGDSENRDLENWNPL